MLLLTPHVATLPRRHRSSLGHVVPWFGNRCAGHSSDRPSLARRLVGDAMPLLSCSRLVSLPKDVDERPHSFAISTRATSGERVRSSSPSSAASRRRAESRAPLRCCLRCPKANRPGSVIAVAAHGEKTRERRPTGAGCPAFHLCSNRATHLARSSQAKPAPTRRLRKIRRSARVRTAGGERGRPGALCRLQPLRSPPGADDSVGPQKIRKTHALLHDLCLVFTFLCSPWKTHVDEPPCRWCMQLSRSTSVAVRCESGLDSFSSSGPCFVWAPGDLPSVAGSCPNQSSARASESERSTRRTSDEARVNARGEAGRSCFSRASRPRRPS